MFNSLVAQGLGPQIPGAVSVGNRVVSPIASSYAVVHTETNRSYNSPPINVQSRNERSTCLTSESRETFSNLFYAPRLSTASQTYKRSASHTVSKSPVKKKLHQKAYVRPFKAIDDNVGHTLPSRSPLPGINRLLYPTTTPLPERGITPTEYNVTTYQGIVSSQNVYQYGLPQNAVYRTASQHYQPPGIQPYGSDLYQMILQYYAASGSNYNFMSPLPSTYQLHQSSRLQLNTVSPMTNWTNSLNFNDNNNCLPWYNLLMAYQQQAFLQNIMSNKTNSESAKNPSATNNTCPDNFSQRGCSSKYSYTSTTGSNVRTEDSVSVEESLPDTTDYTAFNLEPNNTWQSDQVSKNLLEDHNTKYFRPISVPKSSMYVRNDLQADANNNFAAADNFLHGKGDLTMDNYNLKALSDEKSSISRDEQTAHFKTPSYMLQAMAFEKEGLDQSSHVGTSSNISGYESVKRETTLPQKHYLREETLTAEQNELRETTQAWDEYVHKKMSLRATRPRSTHESPVSGLDPFWNNSHKSDAHSFNPQYNSTVYRGADTLDQPSFSSCGNVISDIDRHNLSMFLAHGHTADLWNKGQYFNESISDEETSYSTDIQSLSMCRDTEDTDSAFSPQLNPPSNQSVGNVSPSKSPEKREITPQKLSTMYDIPTSDSYDRRFSMEESDEN